MAYTKVVMQTQLTSNGEVTARGCARKSQKEWHNDDTKEGTAHNEGPPKNVSVRGKEVKLSSRLRGIVLVSSL